MTYQDIRVKYRLTQAALHDLTGIPRRTIEDWSSGKREPPEYVLRLLDFFLERKIKKAGE